MSNKPTAEEEWADFSDGMEFIMAAVGRTRETRAICNRQQAGIKRNAPCPCGSGRKWKRCCGSNEATKEEK